MRNVKADDVLQVLSWLGFSDRAQKGSHHQLVSPNLKRSVTIPAHGTRQPIASGTMNSILNQLEEILDEEQSCLPDHEDWEVLANKEALRTWVNDPKGSRHEIQSVGKCLQGEASPLPLRKRHTF